METKSTRLEGKSVEKRSQWEMTALTQTGNGEVKGGFCSGSNH